MHKAFRSKSDLIHFTPSSLVTFTTILIAGVTALAMSTASAHQYTCQQGSITRIIAVEHEPDQPLPCSVRYEKPDEGNAVSFPWHAKTTAGFCEEKADYLAEKLSLSGWACEKKKSHK